MTIYWSTFYDFLGSDQLKALGAIVVAAAALWRYFRSENQKQARIASRLIERFSKNDKNIAAMRIIDWSPSEFSVKVAGQWKEVQYTHTTFTADTASSADAKKDYTCIVKALRIHTSVDKFSSNEQIVRDVMDSFLSDIERIYFLIQRKAINKEDFDAYFSYWREKIGWKNGDTKDAGELRMALWRYIHFYGFKRVGELFELFGMTIPKV